MTLSAVSYGFRCCDCSAYAPGVANPAIWAGAARCETKKRATTPASDADASALHYTLFIAPRPKKSIYMFGFGKRRRERRLASSLEASTSRCRRGLPAAGRNPFTFSLSRAFRYGRQLQSTRHHRAVASTIAADSRTPCTHSPSAKRRRYWSIGVVDTVEKLIGDAASPKIANVGDKVGQAHRHRVD